MNLLDVQSDYWDRAAALKTFSHPIPVDNINKLLPKSARILDYGCGYGRICSLLAESGYSNVIGIDISSEMVARGQTLNNNLDLRYFDGGTLPFENSSFDLCILIAVLTCIPTDQGQTKVIEDILRVLRPHGIFFLSDYLLQPDARNRERYEKYKTEFDTYGVFRLSDGGVVRHHEMHWIRNLLSQFDILEEKTTRERTMNGHEANVFQSLARKKANQPLQPTRFARG